MRKQRMTSNSSYNSKESQKSQKSGRSAKSSKKESVRVNTINQSSALGSSMVDILNIRKIVEEERKLITHDANSKIGTKSPMIDDIICSALLENNKLADKFQQTDNSASSGFQPYGSASNAAQEENQQNRVMLLSKSNLPHPHQQPLSNAANDIAEQPVVDAKPENVSFQSLQQPSFTINVNTKMKRS